MKVRFTAERSGQAGGIFVPGRGTVFAGQVVEVDDETGLRWTTPIETGRVHRRDPEAVKKEDLVDEAIPHGMTEAEANGMTKAELADWLDRADPIQEFAADFVAVEDDEEVTQTTVVVSAPEEPAAEEAAEAEDGAGDEQGG